MSADVVGKSLELLREAVPAVSRVAVIWNPDNAIFQAQMLRDTQLAAGRLGIELSIVAVRGADYEPNSHGLDQKPWRSCGSQNSRQRHRYVA